MAYRPCVLRGLWYNWAMIILANFLVALALGVMGIGLHLVYESWGTAVFMAGCIGFMLGVVAYQMAHKSRYGHWFDPPVIKADAMGEMGGAELRANIAEISGESEKSGAGALPPRAIKF